jgi:hypothetical protein
MRFYDGIDEINESWPIAGKSGTYEWLNDGSVLSVRPFVRSSARSGFLSQCDHQEWHFDALLRVQVKR